MYSIASSSKILFSSHIKSDRRATFSPKFWWFMVCERPRESLSLPPSICMSETLRPNVAFQWWGLLVMYLREKKGHRDSVSHAHQKVLVENS